MQKKSFPRMFQKSLFLWLVLSVLLVGLPESVIAQQDIELRIDAINSLEFPDVIAYLSVLDPQGFPIASLTKDNLSMTEDGYTVKEFEVDPANEHPVQIAFVLDLSRSTEYGGDPTPLHSSIASIVNLSNSLASEDKIAIITFADDVISQLELTSNKQDAALSLQRELNIGSDVKLNDAIILASDMLYSNSATRPVLILLTDSVDSGTSENSFDQVLKIIEDQNIIVYPIGWGGANQDNLNKLAELSHGEAQYLTPQYPDNLAFKAAFDKIHGLLPAIRSQYRISYTSILPADGKEHQLTVKLDYQGQHIEQTRSFMAYQKDVIINNENLSEGQIIGGFITLSPDIDSPAPMKQLDILVDDQPLTSLLSSPFTYEWDTTKVLPGEHIIKFVATDSAGNSGESSIYLTVQPPITVIVTTPSNGETISGKVAITADVSALAKIAKVEFFVDKQLISTLENPPYSTEWSSTGSSGGGHNIVVSASDVHGFSAQDEIRINIEARPAEGYGGLPIVIAVAAGAAVLVVIWGARSRRKARIKSTNGSALRDDREELPGEQFILLEINGHNPGKHWPLSTTGETTLGRNGDENDIRLKGESASRRHAKITFQNGAYLLINLKPENPIYVNQSPAGEQVVLKVGDIITLGESEFKFEKQG